jgi:hypothetical protein
MMQTSMRREALTKLFGEAIMMRGVPSRSSIKREDASAQEQGPGAEAIATTI